MITLLPKKIQLVLFSVIVVLLVLNMAAAGGYIG